MGWTWLTQNWFALVGWVLAAGGWASAGVNFWRTRRVAELHFKMWGVIEPASTHPREMLRYSFRNSGTAPVHIVSIEGNNGFSLIDGERDYFEPVTIDVDPEPFEDEAPAPYASFMKKRPSRVFAVDSTGKKWPLAKRDLDKIYRTFDEFRASDDYKSSRGNCTCCDDGST